MQRLVIDQPILPLTVAILAHRDVQRRIAAHRHTAVHFDNFFFGHAKVCCDFGDRFGCQVAVFERLQIAFHPAKVEKQLFLCRCGADFDKAPAAQDEFLHRCFDPPHGIGGQTKAAIRVKFLYALHQADIPLGNQLADGKAIAAIAHCDFGNQSQMRRYQLRGCSRVFMLLIALGQHKFLLWREQRKFTDF